MYTDEIASMWDDYAGTVLLYELISSTACKQYGVSYTFPAALANELKLEELPPTTNYMKAIHSFHPDVCPCRNYRLAPR